jgi:hypothetical protein
MRLFRLFLVLLLSVVLPFSNVAATAMVHCAPTETVAESGAADHSDHSGMHAQHHGLQDQSASDHHQHDLSNDYAGCSNCSYCQSCASALVPPLANHHFRINPPATLKTPITSLVPRIFLEEPFRPPALAFA